MIQCSKCTHFYKAFPDKLLALHLHMSAPLWTTAALAVWRREAARALFSPECAQCCSTGQFYGGGETVNGDISVGGNRASPFSSGCPLTHFLRMRSFHPPRNFRCHQIHYPGRIVHQNCPCSSVSPRPFLLSIKILC